MKIGIENFRVFKNYTEFDFKPITIITGQNNSGKSSLIKFLLLVKDNIQKGLFDYDYHITNDIGEPEGWYGVTKKKIDFKDNSHNLSSLRLVLNNKDNPLVFRVRSDVFKNVYREFVIDPITGTSISDVKLITSNNQQILNVTEKTTFVELKLFIEYILLNKDYSNLTDNLEAYKAFSETIPDDYINELIDNINHFIINNNKEINATNQKLEENIHPEFYKNDNLVGVNSLVYALDVVLNKNTDRNIKGVQKERNNVDCYTDWLELNRYKYFFKRLNYLPITKGEQKRVYREKDTDVIKILVNKIENSPLKENIKKFIKKWFNEFNVGKDISYGYDEIKGVYYFEIDGLSLLEYGYGLTQLVSIILNIAITKKNDYLILEEPEANLHPNFQSKLAELFVDAYKELKTHFIIETHSEYIIRKMQYLTAKKEINHLDTNIYYFEHPNTKLKKGEVQVREMKIRPDGIMDDDFGQGFFDESMRLTAELFNIQSLN